jgi:hypothetical protein
MRRNFGDVVSFDRTGKPTAVRFPDGWTVLYPGLPHGSAAALGGVHLLESMAREAEEGFGVLPALVEAAVVNPLIRLALQRPGFRVASFQDPTHRALHQDLG